MILKYTADEARMLKSNGELPASTVINDAPGPGDDADDGFDFDEASDSDASDVDVDAI